MRQKRVKLKILCGFPRRFHSTLITLCAQRSEEGDCDVTDDDVTAADDDVTVDDVIGDSAPGGAAELHRQKQQGRRRRRKKEVAPTQPVVAVSITTSGVDATPHEVSRVTYVVVRTSPSLQPYTIIILTTTCGSTRKIEHI